MDAGSVLHRLDTETEVALLKYLVLLVVLAVLPNRPVDLLLGLNPRRIWLIVVFVAGLSLLGYLLSKVVDPSTAIGLSAVLGGAVSPGMTITSLTEQSRRYTQFEPAFTFSAAIAATMLFIRNIVVVGIVSPRLAFSLALPFIAMATVGLTAILWTGSRVRSRTPPAQELDTPFKLKPALAIGAIVSLLLAAVNSVGVTIPTETTRVGVVVATVGQLTIYTGVTRVAGAVQMARVIAVILVSSASVGISIVLLV